MGRAVSGWCSRTTWPTGTRIQFDNMGLPIDATVVCVWECGFGKFEVLPAFYGRWVERICICQRWLIYSLHHLWTQSDICRLIALFMWYGSGPGSPISAAMGKGYVQELVSRLTKKRISEFDSSVNRSITSDEILFPFKCSYTSFKSLSLASSNQVH